MMLTPEQKRQLEILGYTDPEARVRIRCFVPKAMPLDEQLQRGMAWQKDEKTIISIPIEGWLYQNGIFVRLKKKRRGDDVELDSHSNPIWRETKAYQDGITYLTSLSTKGYGIYFIPNEGGGVDADITRFPALFYECDGISKDEQWQRLRTLEAKLGRSASMVVETRNSLHCYFALTYDSLLPSTWTHYQQRLIQQQQSDGAIWNPARLMRLVGFDHQQWNEQTRSLGQFSIQLASENDNTFTLDEFDDVLPQWDEQRWKQERRSVDRTPSNPVDNPWDIRNLVPYLDEYRQNGRRGRDTCKCPAHNGNSNDSLHVEQSTGAFKCHAGCNPKDVYHAALELAKSHGYQFPERWTGHRFSSLGGWLFNFKRRLAKTLERRNVWGVGHKGEVKAEQADAKTPAAIEYQPGERLDVWAEAQKQGYKYILDTSATGTGKSYDAGMANPELFGVRQLIYASAEHRNPSTPTLKSWYDLEARHKGLYRDEFKKLRRVSSSQPYVVPPNCGRNEAIGALRSKNIPGTDTAELICQTCPNLEPCRAGKVFGFLHDRMTALKQPRLRAHPESLPNANPDYDDTYDYSGVELVWDEVDEIIKGHRSIEVTKTDLDRAITDLAVKLPQVFDSLRPVLTTLHPYLSGDLKQPNKYGWKDAQIREALPKVEGIDVEAVALALAPDLDEFLNPGKEYGVDLAEMTRAVRKRLSDSDVTTSERVSKDMALNWLPDFLDVLLGNAIGNLRIQHGRLTITLPDHRAAEVASAAAGNIFLDATASREDLALKLGCDPEEILVVRQAIPNTSNLEIIQIATMGRLGISSRRKDKDGEDTLLQKRIDALIAQIQQDNPGKVATIDFKCHTQSGDGKHHWWVDSRGVNDMEDCDALVLVGVPCRNLSDLEAEFTILSGRPHEGTERFKYPIFVNGQPSPDLQPYFEIEVSADPEFREFVRRRILADIHQAIGRLRSHRRPDKQLKVYFIGDYPLDIPVTLKKASDITPEAATKVERAEMAIRSAVQQLKEAGQKITQQAIAAITGYTQQHISRFRSLLILLLKDSYSKMSKTGGSPPDPHESPPDLDDIRWASEQYLPLLAESLPQEALDGLLTIFEIYGAKIWRQIWDSTPAVAQVKILSTLIFSLSASELQSLYRIVMNRTGG